MGRCRSSSQLVRSFDGVTDQGPRSDDVIVEEPLEIRLDGHKVATTMRTPGHDDELAAGFCHAEGLLGGARIFDVRPCPTGAAADGESNVVVVDTGCQAPQPTPRLTTTTSSCGWCGTDQIDAVTDQLSPIAEAVTISPEILVGVPDAVGPHQELFQLTGGVHAAAAFDATGAVLVVREDIGRHNAVDKVAGRLLLDEALPATGLGLFVSGRTSFEIVQKAWAAKFATIVAVSAPSSLAIEAAERANVTLAGFARGGRLNLYHQRVPI